MYGRSKLLGEVASETSLTIRTSIIGHERLNKKSFLEWAISQKGCQVDGYKSAIFSGLPTFEIALVLEKYILHSSDLTNGLFHLSGSPISKYDLLSLISEAYELDLVVMPQSMPAIDRSLDSSVFREITGYGPEPWNVLVSSMKSDYDKSSAPYWTNSLL
jgi:dTDP-4-dehydrorhamnose reductase